MKRATKKPNFPTIPLPQRQQRRNLQAEVDLGLYNAIQEELEAATDEQKVRMREVVEWGLKQYLIAVNPDKAIAMGILRED